MSVLLNKVEEAAQEALEIVCKNLERDRVAWIQSDDMMAICKKYGIAPQGSKAVYFRVREAIEPDTLEIFKESGSAASIVCAMQIIKRYPGSLENPTYRSDITQELRKAMPNILNTAPIVKSAQLRLGLVSNDPGKEAVRAPSGPESEISVYVAQYQKLIGRLHSLEIEVTEVKNEIEKYKPIMRAMDLMRDGIKSIKENAK